jgi:hypothetical protein
LPETPLRGNDRFERNCAGAVDHCTSICSNSHSHDAQLSEQGSSYFLGQDNGMIRKKQKFGVRSGKWTSLNFPVY